jgi:hypothetical protein
MMEEVSTAGPAEGELVTTAEAEALRSTRATEEVETVRSTRGEGLVLVSGAGVGAAGMEGG